MSFVGGFSICDWHDNLILGRSASEDKLLYNKILSKTGLIFQFKGVLVSNEKLKFTF